MARHESDKTADGTRHSNSRSGASGGQSAPSLNVHGKTGLPTNQHRGNRPPLAGS